MLIPNNPDIDFSELNRRIAADVQRYQQNGDQGSLPAFNPAPPPGDYELPCSWSELLCLEDEALLQAAYPFLLGRKADNTGLQHWLQELRSGADKFEVLARLRYSPEGKQHNADVHGLGKAHLKSKLRGIPVVGPLLLTVHGWLNGETRHRNYMAQIRHLGLQQDIQRGTQTQAVADLRHKLINDHLEPVQHTQQQQKALLAQLEDDLTQTKRANQELRARLSHLERAPNRTAGEATATADTVSSQTVLSSIPDSFYLAFENRFRGDEKTLQSRLGYYLPLLTECSPLQAGLPLVDVGCGRGEWLLMLPPQYQRIGIDLNSMNVQACHEQGLRAEVADGLHWLSTQAEDSIAAVSAFHVIEHLSFEQLNVLLDQCQRVLAPGGMLIFETPNPENIVTAATHFYTDPTHRHPLPPAFTEFLVQFKGFQEVTIHRLNPIPREYALNEDSEVARRCDALFYGPQDYAITAFKSLQ